MGKFYFIYIIMFEDVYKMTEEQIINSNLPYWVKLLVLKRKKENKDNNIKDEKI